MRVNILVPMAGEGSRFRKVGFLKPKPFIDVAGCPMIQWVFDNVRAPGLDLNFIVVIRREHDQQFNMAEQLRAMCPGVQIAYAEQLTEGAACTTLLAKSYINNDDPLFIVNSDQFIEWDVQEFWKQITDEKDTCDGNIVCFKLPMELNDVKWSYAKVDSNGHVLDVQEKKVISENATVGYYYWRKGSDYVRLAESMISKNIRVNGEFYVAPVYNEGVTAGMKFSLSFCKKMWGLGVPADLTKFLYEYVRPRRTQDFLAAASAHASPADSTSASLSASATPSPRLIAHRGNLRGINRVDENKPEYLMQALRLNFDVETDVWYDPKADTWHLGHDAPQYPITYDFLLQPGLWIHCKNGAALKKLIGDRRINCFFHDRDDFTITSGGWMWIYPDRELLGPQSIAVMFSRPEELLNKNVGGICADNVAGLRDILLGKATTAATATTTESEELTKQKQEKSFPFNGKSKAIIFDLDGVLVESKDLHYVALNEALRREAGPEFIITQSEHESVYDGLSTNQKLNILTKLKGLPVQRHTAVWDAKQELTQEMVATHIKRDQELMDTLRTLKSFGFQIACASNCIRASVAGLLEACGAIEYMDAYFSNEDVKNAKPAPDIYQLAASAFAVDPTEVIIVEDSVKGFEASIRAHGNLVKVKSPHDVRLGYMISEILRVETAPAVELNVVFPLAKAPHQFWLNGPERLPTELPLWLADVSGQPALKWIIDSVTPAPHVKIQYIFMVRESHVDQFNLNSLLPRLTNYAPTRVVSVKSDTLGAAQTVLLARNLIDSPNVPLIICDSTVCVRWDPAKGGMQALFDVPADVGVLVRQDTNPRWGYVQVNGETNDVSAVGVRKAISNVACSGVYFWKRGSDYVRAASSMIDRGARVKGQCFVASVVGESLGLNMSVKAVYALQTWSLRSLEEMSSFMVDQAFIRVPQSMKEIYDSMRARNHATVRAEGAKPDSTLLQGADNRLCHALYTMATPNNWHPSQAFAGLMNELRTVLGSSSQVFYDVSPAVGAGPLVGGLHFTLFQLVKFALFNDAKVPEDYYQTIEAILVNSMGEFDISFFSIAVTQSSVLLLGRASIDLNHHREHVRRELHRIGYPMYEPYKNDIAHMTLVRFASPISSSQVDALLALADKFGNTPLGTLNVGQLTLSPGTWRMQPEELSQHSNVARTLHWSN